MHDNFNHLIKRNGLNRIDANRFRVYSESIESGTIPLLGRESNNEEVVITMPDSRHGSRSLRMQFRLVLSCSNRRGNLCDIIWQTGGLFTEYR